MKLSEKSRQKINFNEIKYCIFDITLLKLHWVNLYHQIIYKFINSTKNADFSQIGQR